MDRGSLGAELSGIKAWAVLLSVAVFGSFVVACGGGAADSNSASKAATSSAAPSASDVVPEIEVPALWAWGDAQDLRTLTVTADAVFKGTVVSLKGERPQAPNAAGDAPGAPAPRWADLPVSQFEVRIESVVSGSLLTDTAVYEQIGGLETTPDGTRVRIMLERDEPVHVGQTYLFFGSFQDDGSVVAPPFGRMKVRPDGSLATEAGWEHIGVPADLSRRTLGDAEREISAASRE